MNTDNQKNYKTIEHDKDYFSAYLNMARHNAFIVLSHITEILGGKPSGEDSLSEMFAIRVLTDAKNVELALKSIKLLDKHFPFLRAMFYDDMVANDKNKAKDIDAENDIGKKYNTTLVLILKHLNTFRNFYTHPVHEPITSDRKLLFYLNTTFDAAVREVKERFQLEEPQVQHLRRYIGKKENLKFFYKFFDDKFEITEKGLAFFICIFLEKKYSIKFLKKLKGFKADNSPVFLSTLETYCAYRIRLPQLRIESTEKTNSLALDMLNELNRCPAPLFELLSKQDQDKFRIKLENTQEVNPSEDEFEEEILWLYSN